MERKLASVQRVLSIEPIPGADAIESIRINGWQCVAKKGEFAVGDLGVYFEIDAVPPDTSQYWFLWTPRGVEAKAGLRPSSARIRTIRLRGSLSQGLLVRLKVAGISSETPEGSDVSDRLGVTKYEAPLPSGMGDARGPFPRAVPKTDEIRVQSLPAVLDELRGHPYVITQKCDGTSATFLISPDDGEFHACGRNWSITPGENCYWSVATKYRLEEKLRSLGGIWALQGEVCGPGIQKNPLGLSQISLFLFNAWQLIEHRHASHSELTELAAQLELPLVELIERGDDFSHDQGSLLSLAEGFYAGTKNEREGIVIRALTPTQSTVLGGRLSFKAISNRYLLAERD